MYVSEALINGLPDQIRMGIGPDETTEFDHSDLWSLANEGELEDSISAPAGEHHEPSDARARIFPLAEGGWVGIIVPLFCTLREIVIRCAELLHLFWRTCAEFG